MLLTTPHRARAEKSRSVTALEIGAAGVLAADALAAFPRIDPVLYVCHFRGFHAPRRRICDTPYVMAWRWASGRQLRRRDRDILRLITGGVACCIMAGIPRRIATICQTSGLSDRACAYELIMQCGQGCAFAN